MLTIPNTGEDVEQRDLLPVTEANAKWYSHSRKELGSCLNIHLLYDSANYHYLI